MRRLEALAATAQRALECRCRRSTMRYAGRSQVCSTRRHGSRPRRSRQTWTRAGFESSQRNQGSGHQQSTTSVSRSSVATTTTAPMKNAPGVASNIGHQESSGVDIKRSSSRWQAERDRFHHCDKLHFQTYCATLCHLRVCLLSVRNKLDIGWMSLDNVRLSFLF